MVFFTGLPLLVLSINLFFLTESPRFLIVKQKFEEATQSLKNMLKRNDRKY